MKRQTAATPLSSSDDVLKFLKTVWQLEHALERASKRMEDAFGISGPQRFAVRMIGVKPGITAGELAMVLHLHPSTVTGILQRLEMRKLIRRAMSVDDARVVHLHLTRAGEKANKPAATGTIERAARDALRRCPMRTRNSATKLLDAFTNELMKM